MCFILQDILNAVKETDHGHESGKENNEFLFYATPVYFVVFVLMAQFVLVNVVVAVLMKVICDREDEEQRKLLFPSFYYY